MSYLFFSSLIRYYRERSAAMYAKLIRTNGFTVAGFRNDRAKFKLDILRTVINSVRHFKKTAVHGKSDEKKRESIGYITSLYGAQHPVISEAYLARMLEREQFHESHGSFPVFSRVYIRGMRVREREQKN